MLTTIRNTLFEVKWCGLRQTGGLLLPKGVSPAPSSFLLSFQLQAAALPLASAQPCVCLRSKHGRFADSLETQSKKREEWGWRGGSGAGQPVRRACCYAV